jgi:hypothetical protein
MEEFKVRLIVQLLNTKKWSLKKLCRSILHDWNRWIVSYNVHVRTLVCFSLYVSMRIISFNWLYSRYKNKFRTSLIFPWVVQLVNGKRMSWFFFCMISLI